MKKWVILWLVAVVLSGGEFAIAAAKEELARKQQRENTERDARPLQSILQAPQDGLLAQAPPPATPEKLEKKAVVAKPPPSFRVLGFRFRGNHSITSEALQTILSGYIGQFLSLDKLQEAADLVTREYHRRGMNFARAYIPVQDVKGGIVELEVVEGRLGEIEVDGNVNYSADFIRRFINRAAGQGVLTGRNLERGLLILNREFADLDVSAELQPGKEPGTVGMRVRVEDRFPVSLTLSANNFGSEYVSRHRFGIQAQWTNALVPGALLTVGGMIGEKSDQLGYGFARYLVPVNASGTKVGVNFSYGRSEVGGGLAILGIWNKMLSSSIFVTHPFIMTRTHSLSGEFGFRYADARYYLLDDFLSSRDKIRLVYAELRGDHIAWGGKSFASFNITQGLGSLLDGTKAGDPYASRFGADNEFTRFNLTLARLQPLNETFAILGRLSGQWSTDSLLASEEWQVGGVDSVRGYGPGEGAGDYGYSASLEFSAAPFRNKDILRLSTFIDHGAAYRKSVVLGQRERTTLTGVGIGASSRIDFYFPINIRVDLGWPISPGRNFLDEKPVFYFSASFRI